MQGLALIQSRETHLLKPNYWGREELDVNNRSRMQTWRVPREGSGLLRGVLSGRPGRSSACGYHHCGSHMGHGCLLSVHRLMPAAANTILALGPPPHSPDLCFPLAAPESQMRPPWAPERGLELGAPTFKQGRSEVRPSSCRPLPGTPAQLHCFPPPPD